MKVLFVGANPSRHNTEARIAFAGTKSGKVLLSWISALGIRDYKLINLIDDIKPKLTKSDLIKGAKRVKMEQFEFDTIIALGNDAAEACKLAKVNCIKLPHPSPSNRILNDKQHVKKLLHETKLLLLSIEGLRIGTV